MSTTIFIEEASPGRGAASELLLAWARDSTTGEPRYILELTAQQRGARCGCECPSCGSPVLAVNAGKAAGDYVRRPHFRHHVGAPQDRCVVLAARLAALQVLREDGWINLPGRRRQRHLIGISGAVHSGEVHVPPERVRLQQVSFRDATNAVLTLADGRELHVLLTGAVASGREEDSTAPTIVLELNDASAAAMSPEELRRHLRLRPVAWCWQRHWDDDQLEQQALDRAQKAANAAGDTVLEGLALPEDLPPELRRETLLHLLVKDILTEIRHLLVPWPSPRWSGRRAGGQEWVAAIDEYAALQLRDVKAECRSGRIVPDITCRARRAVGDVDFWPLFVEVTVTHPADAERLGRIREEGVPTLEIDLQRVSGRVDRQTLRHLIEKDTRVKRWLFHPDLAVAPRAVVPELNPEPEEPVEREYVRDAAGDFVDVLLQHRALDRLAEARSASAADLASDYLTAALELFDESERLARFSRLGRVPSAETEPLWKRVGHCADLLAHLGHLEAGEAVFLEPGGVLSAVLSLRHGRPVGFNVGSMRDLLYLLMDQDAPRNAWHSLYLIAARVYAPALSEDERELLDRWRQAVVQSLRSGAEDYVRPARYDRLLSLLFPEMAQAIAKPLIPGTVLRTVETQPWPWAARLRRGEAAAEVTFPSLPTLPDRVVYGATLVAWKKAHPEWRQRSG